MSIAFLLFFGLTAYSSIIKLFDTKNPEVSISSMTTINYPEIDLFKYDISVNFAGYIPPIIPTSENLLKFFTPVAVVMKLDEQPNAKSQAFIPQLVEMIPYVRCADQKNTKIQKHHQGSKMESEIYREHALCPNTDASS